MKLLLLAVNSAWTHSSPIPYYFRELIRDLHHEVQILELTLKNPLIEALELINSHEPDVLCISSYIWNGHYLRSLIPEIKKILPQCKIVLGGPEATNKELVDSMSRFDLIIEGPGEAAFRELACSDFEDRGFFRASCHIPLRDIAFPYQTQDIQELQNRLLYYETSRGCPFSCIYCLSATDTRNETRFDVNNLSDKQRLFDELESLIALKPKTVKFVDRSFNLIPSFARAVWEYLIEAESECDFHFEIYPELLTDDDIDLLSKAPAKRIRFELGIQSTNNTIMQAVKRNTDWKKIEPILIKLVQETHVRVHTDLLVGLPGENRDSVINSINQLALTMPEAIQLGMLKILPDTPMQTVAKELDYLWMDSAPYQVLASDCLTFGDIIHFEHLAHIINLYWNKAEFTCLFAELLKTHSAYNIFCKINQLHAERGHPLHSVDRAKRFRLINDLLNLHYDRPAHHAAYHIDKQRICPERERVSPLNKSM